MPFLPVGGRYGFRWPWPLGGKTVNGNCGAGAGAEFTELAMNVIIVTNNRVKKFILKRASSRGSIHSEMSRWEKYWNWKEMLCFKEIYTIFMRKSSISM